MTLHEFLQHCSVNDYVGLYDMDTTDKTPRKSQYRFQIIPTPQTYFKIKNIPYGRIGRFLGYEVLSIHHTAKGYFVRIRGSRV